MGNANFFIYGRDRESDRWMTETLLYGENLWDKFKHCVYSFGLKKRFMNCKAIYLYLGRARLVKVESSSPPEMKHLILTFQNKEIFEEFEKSEEQLMDTEIAFLERQFFNKFRSLAPIMNNDGTYQRIWERK